MFTVVSTDHRRIGLRSMTVVSKKKKKSSGGFLSHKEGCKCRPCSSKRRNAEAAASVVNVEDNGHGSIPILKGRKSTKVEHTDKLGKTRRFELDMSKEGGQAVELDILDRQVHRRRSKACRKDRFKGKTPAQVRAMNAVDNFANRKTILGYAKLFDKVCVLLWGDNTPRRNPTFRDVLKKIAALKGAQPADDDTTLEDTGSSIAPTTVDDRAYNDAATAFNELLAQWLHPEMRAIIVKSGKLLAG